MRDRIQDLRGRVGSARQMLEKLGRLSNLGSGGSWGGNAPPFSWKELGFADTVPASLQDETLLVKNSPESLSLNLH